MSTPSSTEVLAALDFPTPCTAPICVREAVTIVRFTHLEVWLPCSGRPLCEPHAEAWKAFLAARASHGVVCAPHHVPVSWRWEDL